LVNLPIDKKKSFLDNISLICFESITGFDFIALISEHLIIGSFNITNLSFKNENLAKLL
jgi:hypothetical protein